MITNNTEKRRGIIMKFNNAKNALRNVKKQPRSTNSQSKKRRRTASKKGTTTKGKSAKGNSAKHNKTSKKAK